MLEVKLYLGGVNKVQDVFIMHESCICQSDVLLQYLYESNQCMWHFCGHIQVAENLSFPQCMFPAEGGQRDALLPRFSSYPIQCPFGVSTYCHLSFAFVFFPWVILLYDVALQQRGNAAPCSKVEGGHATWCREHMCVGETFPFGMGVRQRPWKLWLRCL